MTRSVRGSAGHDRYWRNLHEPGPDAFDFLDGLYSVPGIKATSTSSLAPLRGEGRAGRRRYTDGSSSDGEPRRSGNSALAHRDRRLDARRRPTVTALPQGGVTTSMWAPRRRRSCSPISSTRSSPTARTGTSSASIGSTRVTRRPISPYFNQCRRCPAAGLLNYDRTPKPAYDAFVAFTAETTPAPGKHHLKGLCQGSPTNDPTPSFSLSSSEAGSTFACRIDGGRLCALLLLLHRARTRSGPAQLLGRGDRCGRQRELHRPPRSFTVDTAPPDTTIRAGPSGATSDPTRDLRLLLLGGRVELQVRDRLWPLQGLHIAEDDSAPR